MIFRLIFRFAIRVGICILFRAYRDRNTSEYGSFLPASAVAKKALHSIGATMQVIPARSPDINPIENLFNVVRKNIEAEILQKNIIHQSRDELVERVKFHIWSVSKEYINKTVGSMPNRIKEIVKRKGMRTKY